MCFGKSKKLPGGTGRAETRPPGAMLHPGVDHGQGCVPPEGACLSNLCENTTRAGGSQDIITDNFPYFHMSLKVFKLYWNNL